MARIPSRNRRCRFDSVRGGIDGVIEPAAGEGPVALHGRLRRIERGRGSGEGHAAVPLLPPLRGALRPAGGTQKVPIVPRMPLLSTAPKVFLGSLLNVAEVR